MANDAKRGKKVQKIQKGKKGKKGIKGKNISNKLRLSWVKLKLSLRLRLVL